jgi:ribosome modulation factor
MLDILEIKKHAIEAANKGESKEACPYAESSAHGQLWLDHFYTQVRWLSGETTA